MAKKGFVGVCEALGVVLAGRDAGCEGFSDCGVEFPEESAGLEDEPSFARRRRRIFNEHDEGQFSSDESQRYQGLRNSSPFPWPLDRGPQADLRPYGEEEGGPEGYYYLWDP